jgi:hypothetical protein
MSAKSVATKLLIKPGTTIWSSEPQHLDLIQPLPDDVGLAPGIGQATVALVFAGDSSSLRSTLDQHNEDLAKPTALWVAYPKANRTDINRDSLWPILAEYGLRPITQVAIDDVWSALRFRPLKEGETPFTAGHS